MIDPYMRRAKMRRVLDVATLEVTLALGWSINIDTVLCLQDVRPDQARDCAMYVVDWCRVASEITTNTWPLVVASAGLVDGNTLGRMYRNDGRSLSDDLLDKFPLLTVA